MCNTPSPKPDDFMLDDFAKVIDDALAKLDKLIEEGDKDDD